MGGERLRPKPAILGMPVAVFRQHRCRPPGYTELETELNRMAWYRARGRQPQGAMHTARVEAHMLSPETYAAITIEKFDDGVALATLNRPERLNAANAAMLAEFERLPQDVDGDPDVRVLVVTG